MFAKLIGFMLDSKLSRGFVFACLKWLILNTKIIGVFYNLQAAITNKTLSFVFT